MNCLKCGMDVRNGPVDDSIWQWMCQECGFRWDSEGGPERGAMQYVDMIGEHQQTVIKIVPFGCLAVFDGVEL